MQAKRLTWLLTEEQADALDMVSRLLTETTREVSRAGASRDAQRTRIHHPFILYQTSIPVFSYTLFQGLSGSVDWDDDKGDTVSLASTIMSPPNSMLHEKVLQQNIAKARASLFAAYDDSNEAGGPRASVSTPLKTKRLDSALQVAMTGASDGESLSRHVDVVIGTRWRQLTFCPVLLQNLGTWLHKLGGNGKGAMRRKFFWASPRTCKLRKRFRL